jgi:hypothetical protein
MGELRVKMYETYKEKPFEPKFERAIDLIKPEYRVLLENMKAYQLLFRYKYLEHVSSLSRLCDLVGCLDAAHVVELERNLDAYLCKAMGGVVRSDRLEMVCPECFQLTLTNYGRDGEEIKKCCSNCGFELSDSVSDIEDFDQSLDRDTTYAPTSPASWSKGLGNTFDAKKDLLKLIANNASCKISEFAKINPEIVSCLEGDGSFLVAIGDLAKALLPSVELVAFGDKVYRRMGENVASINLEHYYRVVDEAFHANDLYLRRKKTMLASALPSDLKNALEYGLSLCAKYGFDRKDRDQALFHTVGHDIRVVKQLVKSLHKRHIPESQLVETVFYIDLLKFKKNTAAAKAKSELNINKALFNLYFDFKDFLSAHEEDNHSSTMLNVLEQLSLTEKT